MGSDDPQEVGGTEEAGAGAAATGSRPGEAGNPPNEESGVYSGLRSWWSTLSRRERLRVLVVAGAIPLGIGALGISATRERLWWVFGWFLLGMLALSIPLLAVHDAIAGGLRRENATRWIQWSVGSSLAALAVMFVSVWVAVPWIVAVALAIIGAVWLTLSLGAVFAWVQHKTGRSGTFRPGGGSASSTTPSARTARWSQLSGDPRLGRLGVDSVAWNGFELMALGIGLILISDGVAAIVGALAWLVGLVIAKLGAAPFLRAHDHDLSRIVRILFDVSLVGVFVLFIGAFGGSTVLLLVGGSAVSVGLSMIGMAALQYCSRPSAGQRYPSWQAVAVGCAFVVVVFVGAAMQWDERPAIAGLLIPVAVGLAMIGIAWHQFRGTGLVTKHRRSWYAMGGAISAVGLTVMYTWRVTQNLGLAVVLIVLVAVAAMWFVFRGEGIVILMFVGYILAWGLVDRSVPLDAAAPVAFADDPVEIVALGDSFISGEGAEEFVEGTNDVGGNQCRRAPTSYPYLLGRAFEVQTVSLACSGAKIDDLFTCGQMWKEGRRCREVWPVETEENDETTVTEETREAEKTGEAREEERVVPGELPQLANLTDEMRQAKVVLLSIGGNDVRFSTIVKACLLPRGCEERREIWLGYVDRLGTDLEQTYRDVRAAFSEESVVLVMPYPVLVDEDVSRPCDLGLSKGERQFVLDFSNALDEEIRAAADRSGVTFVGDAVTAFEGAKLCDEEAAANHLKIVPAAGDKLLRYSPGTWIPGSMHPNVLGHRKLATAVACEVAAELDVQASAVRGSEFADLVSGCDTDDTGVIIGDQPDPVEEADTDVADPTAAPADGEVLGLLGAGGLGLSPAQCDELGVADETGQATDEGAGGSEDTAAETTAEGTSEGTAEDTGEDAIVAEDVACAVTELADQVSVVTDELITDDQWIQDELFRTVRALVLPILVALASGLVFAAGFVQQRNPLSRFLAKQEESATGRQRT